MNCLNLIKITPLLLSSLTGISRANNLQNTFSFNMQIVRTDVHKFTFSSNSETFSDKIEKIEFQRPGYPYPIMTIDSKNYNLVTSTNIFSTQEIITVEVYFINNVNLDNIEIQSNNNVIETYKNANNNSKYWNVKTNTLNEIKTPFEIYLESTIDPPDPEPDPDPTPPEPDPDPTPPEPDPDPTPPENPYKDYTNYEIPQSKLETIRIDNSFGSYHDNERFNRIQLDYTHIDIYINKSNQYAKILYSNKAIYLPILGTFLQNNTQYNIVDLYFTNGTTLINLLNKNAANKYFISQSRTQQQSNYNYKNSSFNDNYQSSDKYVLEYETTSTNNIQIITNDVGMGNNGYATITNKQENITTMEMYSIFGINPKTTSYFGNDNPTKVNQFKSGGSVSAPIYQIVEMTNYNEYLQMFTYRNDIDQKLGDIYIPLMGMNEYKDLNINLVAFKTNTQTSPELAINDITTLFSTLDNLEGLGFFPFTFGTIIFIGVVIGFIMVLVKVLKW